MFRALTVARELGSGGGAIARKIAEMLGWDFLDKALVEEIARAACVDPELARRFDERVDSWLHRVARRGLWRGGFEAVAPVRDDQCFDAETMVSLGKNLITAAHCKGECVIIGRGAQCVLQEKPDVFHVFVYAPWCERLARVRERAPSAASPENLIRSTDQERADYIRLYFGCNWKDPHLYHMLISSELGEDEVARIVIRAMKRDGGTQRRF